MPSIGGGAVGAVAATPCDTSLLLNDSANCGACGRACPSVAGLQPVCLTGVCGLLSNPSLAPGVQAAQPNLTKAEALAAADRAPAAAAAPDYATCVAGDAAKLALFKANKSDYSTDPANCGRQAAHPRRTQ